MFQNSGKSESTRTTMSEPGQKEPVQVPWFLFTFVPFNNQRTVIFVLPSLFLFPSSSFLSFSPLFTPNVRILEDQEFFSKIFKKVDEISVKLKKDRVEEGISAFEKPYFLHSFSIHLVVILKHLEGTVMGFSFSIRECEEGMGFR